jgi:hypothetical protein
MQARNHLDISAVETAPDAPAAGAASRVRVVEIVRGEL